MSAKRRNRNKPKPTPVEEKKHVAIQEAAPPVQPEETETPTQPGDTIASEPTEEFIKNNHRKQSLRRNTAKRLRFLEEVNFVNKFTEMYITGAIPKEDIKILADVKAFLLQINGNPYNLKAGEANAMICSDLKHLCIDGEIIGDERVKLEAKEVSANRVAYWNPVLAQQLINATEDEEAKAIMAERLEVLRGLAPRAGYGH